MAVTKIKEVHGRNATWSAQGGRQYRRVYQVTTDTPNDGPQVVLQALGLKYGDRYKARNDDDPGAYLAEVSAEEDSDDGKSWKVTAVYSWFDTASNGGGPNANPLLEPPEIAWGFKEVELVLDIDFEGTPVVNTAGEPFDPPLTYPAKFPVLSIVRNEALGQFVPALAYQYRDAVNSDTFAGEGPGLVKVAQISGKRAWHNDIGIYYVVTYEFEFNPSGFRKRIPSLGMRQKSNSGTDYEQVLINNSPVSNPVLLGSNGRALKPGESPYILEFKAYPELPFAVFAFDEDIVLARK